MPGEVDQVVITCVREADGTCGWEFDAWPLDGDFISATPLATGAASSLVLALEALLNWAKTNAR